MYPTKLVGNSSKCVHVSLCGVVQFVGIDDWLVATWFRP